MSILLGVVITLSQVLNAEIWLDDYPPDIREKFGPISQKAKRQKGIVSIFFLLAALGPIIALVIRLNTIANGSLTFGPVFWSVLISMMTFNLFDLLVLDWLIFAGITPRYIVLPGTEGLAGYGDFGFHARGFVIGTVLAIILSAITAGIAMLVC